MLVWGWGWPSYAMCSGAGTFLIAVFPLFSFLFLLYFHEETDTFIIVPFLRVTYRVLIHMINGNSEDPVGDFLAIQQELQLFNPKLAHKTQVVVVNKIDVPEVRERLPELTQLLRAAAGHSRVLGISALTGERVKELMQRVHGLVALATTQDSISSSISSAIGASKVDRALQQRSAAGRTAVQELFTEEEERVSFADDPTNKEFEVLTDDDYPGQFRVVGRHIEKVPLLLLLKCVV